MRLPLGMGPSRARELRDRAADNVGETMELDVRVSEEMLDEIQLQLSAFGDGD